MNKSSIPKGFGLILFGALAANCSEENEDKNKFLEGLSSKRILMSDYWILGDTKAKIKRAKAPFVDYVYYPPEYLQGKPWTPACTSFAVFTITYKLITGIFPYIGNIPEELLSSNEGLKYIQRGRKEKQLDLSNIPSSFRDFFAKGLALKSKDRYQHIGDTEDEFSELCDRIDQLEQVDLVFGEDLDNQPHSENTQSEFDQMLSQCLSPSFLLDVKKGGSRTLDNLAGLHKVKEYLRNEMLFVLKYPEKAKRYKLKISNGALFYGAPGTGKTATAESFAEEIGWNYAIIHPQDVASPLYHGTAKMIKELFEQAAKHAPIILIFDEIECIIPDRGNRENSKSVDETSAFITELNTCAERGIFVICCSNYPMNIDPAILRSERIDKRLYFPLPDEDTRKEIFRINLLGRPVDQHIDYQKLCALTSSGYVSSDISQICDQAAYRACKNDTLITQAIIEQTIHDGGPTVPKNALRTYEDARRFMEPNSKYSPVNQIGFR